MQRNPNWTRDELILALDLYFQIDVSRAAADHPDIVSLSNLLNSLPIHDEHGLTGNFRNPNGVYMKLCNFLRLDPDYPGAGLRRGSRLDETVWNEFSKDKNTLHKVANSIRHNYEAVRTARDLLLSNHESEEAFFEGKVLVRLHKLKERDPAVVRAKKNQVLDEEGRLECEVCGFDFEEVYGDLGRGFAECHHLVPISELKHEQRTRLSDLAIVCSNCHRMLHRASPPLSIQELQEIIIRTQ